MTPPTPPVYLYPTTVSLLSLYGVGVLYGLLSTSNDPQRGMANGFLIFVLLLLVGLGALSWLGTHPYRPWLARLVFVICVLPP
ncbi:hypothetical protein [Paludibaculum fermentans]|uniref:hypothetical protein n=1 Tax=Paludibaculum fermentans TaxID=1473598 RepID=UPI003EBE909E